MMCFLKKFNIDSSAEGLTVLLVGLLWAREPVLLFADIVLSRFGWIGSSLIPISITILVIVTFPLILRRAGIQGIVMYIYILILFYVTYLLYPSNTIILEDYEEQFLMAAPYIIVGLCVDFEKMEHWLYFLSVISIVVIIVQIRIFATEQLAEGFNEMMVTSYRMLPHTLMVLYYTFKEKTLLRIIISIVAVVSIVSFGSRGPLMCVIAFLLLYLIIVAPFRYKNRVRIIMGAVLIFAFYFSNDILELIQPIIKSAGMSTRIIDYAIGNQLFDDSGRGDIHKQLFAMLNEKPIFGYGLAGDRTMTGMYAHQILYELLFSFGYFIGGVLFLIIVCVIYSAIKHTASIGELMFVLILFCCGFLSLFMSGTFITSQSFYMLLGYCFNLIKNNYKRPIKEVLNFNV